MILAKPCAARAPLARVSAKRSKRTGTANSAAALGVGARMSETKSINVVSVSWPTAEIRGISEAAAARATISSLNPQRSSMEPPPRATISKSGLGRAPPGVMALNPAIARATSAAQLAPCTATGQTKTFRGKRSRRRCRISRITAPVGEVTTPITSGKKGKACLRAGSNNPSAAKAVFRFSNMAINAPTPATATSSTFKLYLDCPPKEVILPLTTTSIPSSGRTESFDT